MNKIKSKILGTELLEWKKFEFIQSDSFKKFTKTSMSNLKESIIQNDFIETFKVWKHDNKYFCLDGYHRCMALQEIEQYGHNGKFYSVPDKLSSDLVDCKNHQEASKLVLIYSSQYAKIEQKGFLEFIELNDLDLSSFVNQIDIPNIKLTGLNVNDKETIAAFEEPIMPYRCTHILISFKPEKISLLKPLLEQLYAIDGIEYEQSSN